MVEPKVKKMTKENLRDFYEKLEGHMAEEGMYLTPRGEWEERRQSFFYSRYKDLKRKLSRVCCYPWACIVVLGLSIMVWVLANLAAWLGLPILLGSLVFLAFTPRA